MAPDIVRSHDMRDLTLYVVENVLTPNVLAGTAYDLALLTFAGENKTHDAFITYALSVDDSLRVHIIMRQANLNISNL